MENQRSSNITVRKAFIDVKTYESGLLARYSPNEKIKPICTFRSSSQSSDNFTFSPNGRFIALMSAERVYIWDREKSRTIQVFNHPCSLDALAFSRDGRLLISGDHEKRLYIWDVQSGECVRVIQMENRANVIRAVTDELLVVKEYWGKISVWEINTGENRFTLENYRKGLAITPDQKAIISTNFQWKNSEGMQQHKSWYALSFWDVQTGELLKEYRFDYPEITLGEIIITTDGKKVLSLADEGKAFHLIDLDTGRSRKLNFLDSKATSEFNVNQNGHLLLTCRDNYRAKRLCIWDIEKGTCLRSIPGEWRSPAFSPDGEAFAALDSDGAVQLWEVDNGQQHRVMSCHADAQTNLAITSTGTFFVTDASDYTLTIWDLRTGQSQRLIGHRDFISDIAISPNNKTLVSASHDNTIRLWDLASGHCIGIWRMTRRPLNIVFKPDSQWFAVSEGHAREEQSISIRDLKTGRVIQNLTRVSYFEKPLAFSPDGQFLYTCSYEDYHDSIRKWDLAVGKCQWEKRIDRSRKNVYSSQILIDVNRDIWTYVEGINNKKIFVRDLKSGEELLCLEGHQKRIVASILQPERSTLISADEDFHIYEWDLHSGNRIREFTGHPISSYRWREIRNLAIAPEKGVLIAAGFDGVISIWDYETGRLSTTMYALDEGYLWRTPADDFAKDGWLHADRPDLISLGVVESVSKKMEYLSEDDERFMNYMRIYNDGEMVMTRINDWERYQELLWLRIGNKSETDHKLIKARVQNDLRLLTQPDNEG